MYATKPRIESYFIADVSTYSVSPLLALGFVEYSQKGEEKKVEWADFERKTRSECHLQIEEHFTDYKVEEGAEKEGDVLQWKDMNENIDKGEKGDIVLDARPSGR